MRQTLEISAIDYCRGLQLSELDNSLLQQLPISSYPLLDGMHQIMSRYVDEEWRLENTRFPSSTNDYKKIFRFNTLPKSFVESTKFAIKRYDIRNNPRGGTLCNLFRSLRLFFTYLERIHITSTAQITPMVCANYVQSTKSEISKRTKKLLGAAILLERFLAVETLYEQLKGTDYAFKQPWYGSSAAHLAGLTGQGKIVGKTEIIAEKDMQTLVQYCYGVIQKADALIALKREVEQLREEKSQVIKHASQVSLYITMHLIKPRGYLNLRDFNEQYDEIFSAVAIIVMAFSGIRTHELAYIKLNEHGMAYRVEDNEDDVYYWLQSSSDKTYEGDTEWLVPEIVIEALEVQTRYIKSLQNALEQEQQALFAKDPHHPRALNIESFKRNLFLTYSRTHNKINPMSNAAIDVRLKKLAKKLGIAKLHAHQFRRTFAVYVAQSIYGDLRYLKKHFKHWGLDMTLSYASNEKASLEMINEISVQVKNYKISIIEDLLNEETIVAGGLANNIVTYRSRDEAVKTFKTRAEMAEKISDTIYLRSTGHSWCTSDNNGCGGRSAIEGTACVECDDSIIEKKRHGAYFKGIYIQQIELRKIDDIGPAGKQRVERDIQRCEKVLKELGIWDEVKGLAA